MKVNDSLKLEKQLCFRLYSLSKLMNRLYSPILKELQLTYPQYLVMLVLWNHTNDIIIDNDTESETVDNFSHDSDVTSARLVSIKQLGAKLDLDSGTLSPLLKRMEKLGFISRHRSNLDERSVEIKLTLNGRQLKEQAAHIPEQMFSITGMTIDELQGLNTQLDKLLNHMS